MKQRSGEVAFASFRDELRLDRIDSLPAAAQVTSGDSLFASLDGGAARPAYSLWNRPSRRTSALLRSLSFCRNPAASSMALTSRGWSQKLLITSPPLRVPSARHILEAMLLAKK